MVIFMLNLHRIWTDGSANTDGHFDKCVVNMFFCKQAPLFKHPRYNAAMSRMAAAY